MKKLLVLFCAALTIFCATAATAQDTTVDPVLAKMKPLLEDGTLLIAHVDFTKINVTETINYNRKTLEKVFADLGVPKEKLHEFIIQTVHQEPYDIEKSFNELIELAESGKKMLTDAYGIKEAFVVLQFGRTFPNFFHVAIPKTEKLKVELIRECLKNLGQANAIMREADDYIFISIPPMNTYLDNGLRDTFTAKLGIRQQADRPDFIAAYNEVKDDPIKILVAIPPYVKNVVAELQPKLPEKFIRQFPALDAVNISQFVNGFKFKAIGIKPEQGKIRIIAETESELDAQQTATQLDKIATVASDEFLKYLESLKKRSDSKEEFMFQQESLLVPLYQEVFNEKSLATLKAQILPKPEGKRFSITFDTTKTGTLLANSGITFDKLLELSVKVVNANSKLAHCQNNMKNILVALHVYFDAHSKLPPTFSVDKNGKPLHSWRVLILPYLEHAALYDSIRINEPWDSEYNKQFHDKMPQVFKCPVSTKGNPKSDTVYSMVVGEKALGRTDGKGLEFNKITDGMSNTIGIVERATPVCWMSPEDVKFDDAIKGINKIPEGIGSEHDKGAVFGFLDGSVRFLSQNIDLKVLEALLTIAGGESAAVPRN